MNSRNTHHGRPQRIRYGASPVALHATRLLLVCLLTSLAGCSYQAYRSGSLPASEAADLRVKNYRSVGAAWNAVVEEVDGSPTPWAFRESSTARNFLFNGPAGGEKSIDLAPGHHTLKLRIFWDQFLSGDSEDAWSTSHCDLTFAALPGEHYELASDYWRTSLGQWFSSERDWTAWVVRTGTSEVVSTDACVPADGVASSASAS
jgi:hypothetical protein